MTVHPFTRAQQRSKTRPDSRARRIFKARLASRDGRACRYCARPFPDLAVATFDHVAPFGLLPGWTDDLLVLACRGCNDAKADRLPLLLAMQLAPVQLPSATWHLLATTAHHATHPAHEGVAA